MKKLFTPSARTMTGAPANHWRGMKETAGGFYEGGC